MVFHKEGLEEDTYQFDIDSITSILDVACYKQDEEYMVAIATDDHAVLSYSYCSGNVNDDPFAEVGDDPIIINNYYFSPFFIIITSESVQCYTGQVYRSNQHTRCQ